MGYRSQVLFVIEFNSNENAEDYFKEVDVPLIDWATKSNYFYLQENLIIFDCNDIKWYESYEDTQHLERIYKKSTEAEGWVGYVFKRMGEDHEDYEEEFDSASGDWDYYDYIKETRLLELGV